MVNSDQQYLQDLYDYIGTVEEEMERQESAQETTPDEPHVEIYKFVNGSLQRVGG
tara:strand:+ start:515 stop:679 length:165 start_codon:yes stop_codon:yes gene_type:complete